MDLESIVLLENRNNTLPIKKGSRVALIGPQAGQSNVCQIPLFSICSVAPFTHFSRGTSSEITYSLLPSSGPPPLLKDSET